MLKRKTYRPEKMTREQKKRVNGVLFAQAN